jgi:hypothetical protein
MKKILISLLTISLGFNVYLLSIETVIEDNFDSDLPGDVNDAITLAQSSVEKKSVTTNCDNNTIKDNDSVLLDEHVGKKHIENKITDVKNESEETASSKAFDRIQQKWFENSNEFFEQELGLSNDQIAQFHELKVQRTQELDDHILPRLEEHRKANGEKVPYLFTMEDSIFMGNLNQRYMKRLKEVFGDYAFEQYQQFKTKFNQKLMAKKQNNMLIDF